MDDAGRGEGFVRTIAMLGNHLKPGAESTLSFVSAVARGSVRACLSWLETHGSTPASIGLASPKV
jgi:hypothetical protein